MTLIQFINELLFVVVFVLLGITMTGLFIINLLRYRHDEQRRKLESNNHEHE